MSYCSTDRSLEEMRDEQPGRSIEEIDEQQLEIFRTMFHAELGVAAALHYCAEHKIDAPAWLVKAASDLMFKLLKNEKTKKIGRSAGPVARYLQDMKDLLRANLIKETLEQQKEIPKTIQELRALKARKATAEQRKKLRAIEDERQKMRNWVGTGWDAAYDCASMMLQGTDAHAGAPAMKATYLKVIKNNRKQPLRYYVLGSKIERRLGINCDFPRQVKKRVPFYDLTL